MCDSGKIMEEDGESAVPVPDGAKTGASRRHYKKDSIYLNDLYTITYDDDEDDEDDDDEDTVVDEDNEDEDVLGQGGMAFPATASAAATTDDFMSLAHSWSPGTSGTSSSGPMSLGFNHHQQQRRRGHQRHQWQQQQTLRRLGEEREEQHQKSLPSLETNLHKILARKIQDSEEVTIMSLLLCCLLH